MNNSILELLNIFYSFFDYTNGTDKIHHKDNNTNGIISFTGNKINYNTTGS